MRVFVDCVPVPQPRPRASGQMRSRGGRMTVTARVYNPSGPVDDYRALVRDAVRNWPTITSGPVVVFLSFHFPRPQRIVSKKKPNPAIWCPLGADLDNLAKATLDAMNGRAFADDKQVCRLVCEKYYCAFGSKAGVWIDVEELNGGNDVR